MENLIEITGVKPSVIKEGEFEKLFDESIENYYESKETFNNGEFSYKLFIEVVNCADFDNEVENSNESFLVSLSVVKTKKHLSKKNLESIMQCCGITRKEVSTYDIATYGLQAGLTSFRTKDLKTSLNFLANISNVYTGMLGFFLDRPQNRIGNTGWDFLDGKIGF